MSPARSGGRRERGHWAHTHSHQRARGQRGGRSPAFDRQISEWRNVIERCFNGLKQFRAVATRYDTTATSYWATVTLACLLLWLRMGGRDDNVSHHGHSMTAVHHLLTLAPCGAG